jgi:tRNA threonylcarbamoyladenosine biosynthesis protein TsaB
MLLAIDTSTAYSSLALHDGETLLAEDTWRSADNNHTVDLAPSIHTLLERCGWAMSDLTALAVAIGPGSYTGLRIGVAMAKGLASALQLRLVGVSSLDILAVSHPQVTGTLITVVQAGRGRVIAGAYQWRKGKWKPRTEPSIMDWATLVTTFESAVTVMGEIDEKGRAALSEAQAQNPSLTIASPAMRLRRAGWLAEEAWLRLNTYSDEFVAAQVVPIYVKTKDIP